MTDAMHAAPLILEKYPETLFLIGGDGPTKNAWIEKAEAAGLSGAFLTDHFPTGS